jgi:hypothetical protein
MRTMRNRGGMLLVLGVAGFLYCSVRASDLPPLSTELSVTETLHEPRGRWEALRDVSVFVGACGALLVVFGGRGR